MNLHTLAVGQRYHPDRGRWDEATQYNYRAGAHELVVFMPAPSRREVRAWEAGPWEFGLVVRPELLFLLFKPGDMPWSDAPYSWWQVKRARPEEATAPFELPNDTSRALLSAILVDAETGLVRVIKAITFSPAFSRALHAAITEQMAAEAGGAEGAGPGPGASAYGAAVDRYYRIYPETDPHLLARAMVRCRGGEE